MTQPVTIDNITLYRGDCFNMPELFWRSDFLITDPPYGVNFQSNRSKKGKSRKIIADETVEARDKMLALWGDEKPAAVFGTWKQSRPTSPPSNIIAWLKGAAPGMGDLRSPFGQAWEEIYIYQAHKFAGKRVPNHINIPTLGSSDRRRPKHPTPKPVELMLWLLGHVPRDAVILDPFMGAGATMAAARILGMTAVGIELDAEYFDLAVEQVERAENPQDLIREKVKF